LLFTVSQFCRYLRQVLSAMFAASDDLSRCLKQHRFFLHAVAMIGGDPLRQVDMETYM